MSSKKRRIKRKLAQLVRMDKTYVRLYVMTSRRRDPMRSWPFWWCVVALGDAMTRRYGDNKGWRGMFPPGAVRGDALMLNYAVRRRNGGGA